MNVAYAYYRVINDGCIAKVIEYKDLGIIEQDNTTNIDPDQINQLELNIFEILNRDITTQAIRFDKKRGILTITQCPGPEQYEKSVRFQTNGKTIVKNPLIVPVQKPSKGCKYKVGESCDLKLNMNIKNDSPNFKKYFRNPNSSQLVHF